MRTGSPGCFHMNQINELTYLYQRYRDETCTPEERQAFMALVRKPELAVALKELISQDAAGLDEGLLPITKELSRERAEELFILILATPSAASTTPGYVPTEFTPSTASATTVQPAVSTMSGAPVYPFNTQETKKRRWWPAAAAAVLLLLAGAGYLVFNQHSPAPVARLPLAKPPQNDVLPGGNKAMLKLSNGSVIILDSAANGLLAEQGSAKVSKPTTGQLAYEEARVAGTAAVSEKPVAPVYNTLSTPRGGQYQLMLPDGTKVWLNAASSITYPTSFEGGERRITMTGEAYFEVAKMLAPAAGGAGHVPFIVVANGTEVEVLGTHFNVNAYKEEPAVLTTLLEGSVKVLAHGNKQMIKPGEQTVVTPSGTGIGLNRDVDLDEVVAWKNGYFQFDHADIQTIMRQVARWYDVEISYEGKVPERKFGGDISRDLKLSEVLYGLNLSRVHFRIEGKKLVILP
jgi:transmembrane sensor